MIDLKQGDCLVLLKDIPDKSIDMILCDPPYGTTNAPWDKRLDLDLMFKECNRIITDHGCMAFFCLQPFQTDLINANRQLFRYEWVWDKCNACGFLNANRMPLRVHENIAVFYKHLPVYNPQFGKGKPFASGMRSLTEIYGKHDKVTTVNDGEHYYPTDIIKFSIPHVLFGVRGGDNKKFKHSTQKPVPLLEYLIKTYTNEGDTVLDFCMGSGSTGVACVNTGRSFIGMELNGEFFELARDRILNSD